MIAAPAMADPDVKPLACPNEVSYPIKSFEKGWFATKATSAWLAGPGTITYQEQEAAQFTGTISANWTFTVSGVFASVSGQYGVSLAASTTTTKSWSYSKSVPAGKTKRVVVHKHGAKYTFHKITVTSSCNSTTQTGGSGRSPYKSDANAEYCVALDTYPATEWQGTNGACSDH